MIRAIDVEEFGQALLLLQLQMEAYLLEAEWLGLSDVPPLRDSVSSLSDSGESFFGWYEDAGNEEFAGAIAYGRDQDSTIISRLMVRSAYFRKGIASALLRFVEEREAGGLPLKVIASTHNIPAMRLYEKHGFRVVSVHETAAGVSLTTWIKPQ